MFEALINSPWFWIAFYLVGAFFTCRLTLAMLGWREDWNGNIEYRLKSSDDPGSDDPGFAAAIAAACWPFALVVLAIKKTGEGETNILVGRPPKHLRTKLKEQRREAYIAELERKCGIE